MPRAASMGVASGWDPQFSRMIGVSAGLHAAVLVLALVVLPLVKPSPLPLVAYTVELTDPSSLGGHLAPGRPDQPMGARAGAASTPEAPAKQGEPVAKSEPAAPPKEPEPPKPIEKAEPPAPPAPVEPPKPVEPAAKLPSIEKPPPKPEAKKAPEPTPEPKPEPKPEAKKPEPPKPQEVAKPEPPKATTPKPETAKPAPPKTADAKPAADAKPSAEAKTPGKPMGKPDATATDGADASDSYGAAAQKWRAKGATGGGGGLGGTDTSDGPLGTPGYGPGGGGQVVGFEFLAYQQRVVSMVKAAWTNAVTRPGLVAKVRFQIAPNGDVSSVRLEQPSGDGTFDGSVLRAVQRSNPLPAPPSRYANEFRDFVIEFHSEEEGGHAAG
jgi:colicin import membrane protein